LLFGYPSQKRKTVDACSAEDPSRVRQSVGFLEGTTIDNIPHDGIRIM
jgi:hypothetical protein